MILTGPSVELRHGRVYWSINVEDHRGCRPLWFSVPEDYADWLTPLADPGLIGLLPVAMLTGQNIWVGAPVSSRLLHGLRGATQALLRIQCPDLRESEIHADDVVDSSFAGRAVATGFSSGVDSFAVLDEHLFRETEPGFRLTHLFFNHVGSHGVGGWGLFQQRFARLRPVAEEIGLPFLSIDSNLDSFYPAAFAFQRSHSFRNAAVAHLLRKGVGRFLYASGFHYRDCRAEASLDMGTMDPFFLPKLSVPGLELLSSGSNLTRVEKTLRIAEWPVVRKHLNVCVCPYYSGPRVNCSACWKCLRTLATLEITGKLEDFREVFDLNTYRQHREAFFTGLEEATDPLLREVKTFAEERGFDPHFAG